MENTLTWSASILSLIEIKTSSAISDMEGEADTLDLVIEIY